MFESLGALPMPADTKRTHTEGGRAPRVRRAMASAHGRTAQYSSPPCLLAELEDDRRVPRARADVRIKRIYEKRAPTDGYRVLVDRIWPRGIKKADAALDQWARELAPTTALRKWFAHDPRRWSSFGTRYRAELAQRAQELEALRQRAARGRVTLLFAARNKRFNHAVVLQDVIADA